MTFQVLKVNLDFGLYFLYCPQTVENKKVVYEVDIYDIPSIEGKFRFRFVFSILFPNSRKLYSFDFVIAQFVLGIR